MNRVENPHHLTRLAAACGLLSVQRGYAVGDLDGQTDGGHGPSVVYSTPAYLFVHELKRADVHPPRQVVAPSSV